MMMFELVAARLLAPTIGNSTFIWTNVIGVIMGALAVGYSLGGKIADRRHRETDIVRLCLVVAILVAAVLAFHPPVIDLTLNLFSDARWQGLVAALILFAPVSVVIGMISPYLAKLSLKNTKETGETIARLSTWNAIGSITGTFVTGFVLFGLIGSRSTMAVVIIIMLAASWLVHPRAKLLNRAAVSVAILLAVALLPLAQPKTDTVSIDTVIGNYRVVKDARGGRAVTYLLSGPGGIQSGVYGDGEKELVFWYTQEIANVVQAIFDGPVAAPERILVIGGGAFTLPEYFGRTYPKAQVDVVEIDTELEAISREYFRFEKPENVTVYAEDARSYVNRISGTDEVYDAIIVDAFSDTDVPWQFVTGDFGRKVAGLLAENGVVIANTVSALGTGCSGIFEAEVATYSPYLPHVYVKSQNPHATGATNRELVFARDKLALEGYDSVDAAHFRSYTDDFAPIEHLWQACLSAY